MLYMDEEKSSPVSIKVIGVGGGGMNAVTRMINANLKGVQFIIMNTDEQVLNRSNVENKVQIGNKITKGMGAGGDPEIGAKAAQEDRDKIASALKGADMVFITAGMGGGTGTGAAPIVAEIAKELKCLVVGVVTVPFVTEGKKRGDLARNGLNKLRSHVDTLITIKNDSILKVVDKKATVQTAFKVVDDVLLNAVKGISDIINYAGIINVDFADVRTIMKDTGDAIMGVGEGTGDNRVADAVNQAINNVLLEESSIEGATSLLINVSGGKDLSISDWNDVSQAITSHVDQNANIIIGLNEEEGFEEKIRVTVIATGFKKSHLMSPSLKKEVPIKEKEKESEAKVTAKVVNIMDNDILENNRNIRPRTSSGYNYTDELDIPTYLRKGIN
jgi:cell division protein FtsZ